jgi:hypothetical protein
MSVKSILKKIIPERIRYYMRVVMSRVGMVASHTLYYIYGKRIDNPKDIPIIINNYNRLDYLKQLIGSLESRGYHNIRIIDNKSNYQPLLDYYDSCPYKVYRLDKNVGYLSIWQTDIYKEYIRSYYVYTDSDMRITDDCPDDFMAKFVGILKKYPMAQKAGFGLKIDDLPDTFKNKDKVLKHEARFWHFPVGDDVYAAEIDTTFALYRPFCKGKAARWQRTFRTGGKYQIHHLPWYVDSENMTEEEQYYVNTIAQSTYWSQQAK